MQPRPFWSQLGKGRALDRLFVFSTMKDHDELPTLNMASRYERPCIRVMHLAKMNCKLSRCDSKRSNKWNESLFFSRLISLPLGHSRMVSLSGSHGVELATLSLVGVKLTPSLAKRVERDLCLLWRVFVCYIASLARSCLWSFQLVSQVWRPTNYGRDSGRSGCLKR